MWNGRAGSILGLLQASVFSCASAGPPTPPNVAPAAHPSAAVPREPAEPPPAPDPMIRIPGQDPASTFWLDRDEVGLVAYRRCVAAGVCDDPELHHEAQSPHPEGPVTATWPHALRYCAWAGKRLPTANEWLWAARGRDEQRSFPWGEETPTFARMFAADDQHEHGHIAGEEEPNGPHVVSTVSEGERLRMWLHLPTQRGARPLGSSRDGVRDMLGNVQEAVVLASGEHTYVGGGYFYSLPGHFDMRETGWDPERLRRLAASHLMTPLPPDEPASFGLDRGYGFRCAADKPPPGTILPPEVTIVGARRVLHPPGMRRYGEAKSLCTDAGVDNEAWSLPTATELADAEANVLGFGELQWTRDGQRWSGVTKPELHPAETATAQVFCVHR